MKKTFISHGTGDTERIGHHLAEKLLTSGARRAFVALYGEMGVGKTAFSRGFTSAITSSLVRSPTYTVVNEYRGGELPVFHFDMYRIDGEDDLVSVGFFDYLSRDGYCLCEWSENISEDIPEDAYKVTLLRAEGGDEERIITIEGSGFSE